MTGHHLHLVINHFPAVGLVFSVLILGGGLLLTNKDFVRAGLLLIFLSGVLAIPAYLSGENAEETLEKSPRYIESLVEGHEEAAEFAIWSIGIAALAAATGLYFSIKRPQIPKVLMMLIVALQVFSLAVIARTNNLGGRISHPEIRDSAKDRPPAESEQ